MYRSAAFICVLTVAATYLHDVQALSGGAVSHFEPQVAVLCDPDAAGGQQAYHPQYMNEQGRWQTDLAAGKTPASTASTCLKDKMDILEYCKKVYPKRDITNIVESSHYLKVGSWCRAGGGGGGGKCKTARWVKPFRCLEGPFQSDALLVPENCLFDHIHNQSKCWTFGRWNETAAAACQDRGLQLRSFAMLLPCGISLFSGVEFVCCPRHFRDSLKPMRPAVESAGGAAAAVDSEDDALGAADDLADEDEPEDEPAADDEDDGDEYDDDDGGEEDYDKTSSAPFGAGTSTTMAPTTAAAGVPPPAPTPDPYFTHFDPRVEHQSYKEAQERLEENHREKVTRVMKDWSDLEERYQDMRATDPRGADAFKQRMTQRFQQTVQALEEEGDAEKHQLAAMHQQRVLAHINQRKKEAMACYTQSLNEQQPANTHRVQKCLQKLLRALHKDRAHAIAHYRHLLAGSLEAAAREQPRTLERLTDIDRTVNQSLQMLRRYPDLTAKIGQLMDDYVQALRSKDETPGSLLAMTTEAEAAILDKYRVDVAARHAEKERQREQERERKEQRKRDREDIVVDRANRPDDDVRGAATAKKDDEEDEDEDTEDESVLPPATGATPESSGVASTSPGSPPPSSSQSSATVDDAAVQQAVEEVAAVAHQQEVVRVAHAMAHDLGHGEPTYSVRREVYGRKSGRSVYFTLAFAGIALMAALVVGVAVARRRSARSPHGQGFVEVDQAATPEERHVANMQINGYENPTYKYFEVKE